MGGGSTGTRAAKGPGVTHRTKGDRRRRKGSGSGRPARPVRWLLPGALLLAGALLPAACGDDGTEVDPRDRSTTELLEARLVSPHDAEGGVLVEASAERVLELRAVDPWTTVYQRTEEGRIQAALIRTPIPGEIRFEVVAVEARGVPEFGILQVTDAGNQPRETLDGYRVEVTR